MIQANHLCRKYGEQFAVEDLSFHVRKGEVMGLLGPNGAGKSTTMKMLTCFLPPSSGEAFVDGVSLQDSIKVRRKVGYLPENAPSYSDLDVCSHLKFIGSMHGLMDAALADRIREMGALCGLEHVMYRRIDELSKGFRQRVGLAASMLHDPACLIFDEPTTGLDPNQIVEIRKLIRRLGEKRTVLLSSHVLPEVEAVCDRMMIIDKGQLQVMGTARELSRQARGEALLYVTFKASSEVVFDLLRESVEEVGVELRDIDAPHSYAIHHPDPDYPLAEALFHAAVSCGAVILEMHSEQATLEDVFRKLTGGGA
ncbi:MAG: ATP-binding cassette domain-containing protein [Mariprofundaceae bacterium]|nr:ATP-binding cassette domain-containing protein [Mariprofundaceae bacterium]